MRVLLIEDEKKLADSVKESLETEGYAVDVIYDGLEAERRIELYHADYDLIILDWMLPGKDGEAICRDMRKQGIPTPVLMLTAKGEHSDRAMGLDAGADDYMGKPFFFDELAARMRALLRRPKAVLSETLQAGDLLMNQTTKKVYQDGKEVKLSSKEFRILEYMMRNPNRVLNREQILDNVWDFNATAFSNVVDVYMYYLRRKLDRKMHGKAFLIETVRGEGYRLLA